MNRQEISPDVDGLLQRSEVLVERSFSMLSKLLAKARNFLSESITNYMCVHYDLSTNRTNFEFF